LTAEKVAIKIRLILGPTLWTEYVALGLTTEENIYRKTEYNVSRSSMASDNKKSHLLFSSHSETESCISTSWKVSNPRYWQNEYNEVERYCTQRLHVADTL